MSAPLIWIVSPALMAGISYIISRWQRSTILLSAGCSLLLALLAWRLPVGKIMTFGERDFIIEPALVFLGRRLELLSTDQPLLVVIYLCLAFWLGGSYVARSGHLTAPIGFGVTALLIAALAVEPFLYAALLIEMAVLLCVPLLVQAGTASGHGALRFISLQTFGMPFILFAGYLLAGIESNPGDPILTMRVGILIGMGFCFLLAIFPFHSWLPMIAEESHPYLAAFIFTTLPQMVMLFALSFLERYAWIRAVPTVFVVLRGAGVLMIVIGGMWAGFQLHLGRILGYATMIEIGFGLLALAALKQTSDGLLLHFSLLPARVIALGVWALALSVLRLHIPTLDIRQMQGFGRHLPLAAAGLFLAQLSLAGFPLLASFPPRFTLLIGLSSEFPFAALLTLLGSAGLFIAALRTLMVLFAPSEKDKWLSTENLGQRFFLVGGIILLFTLGTFSPWLLPRLQSLLTAFPHILQ